MDNFKIKNRLKLAQNSINGMLLNLDNFDVFKYYLGALNNNVEILNSLIIAEDNK